MSSLLYATVLLSFLLFMRPFEHTQQLSSVQRCVSSLSQTVLIRSSWDMVTMLRGIVSHPSSITNEIATPELQPLNCPILKVKKFSLDPQYHWIYQNVDGDILCHFGFLFNNQIYQCPFRYDQQIPDFPLYFRVFAHLWWSLCHHHCLVIWYSADEG